MFFMFSLCLDHKKKIMFMFMLCLRHKKKIMFMFMLCFRHKNLCFLCLCLCLCLRHRHKHKTQSFFMFHMEHKKTNDQTILSGHLSTNTVFTSRF